MRKAQQDYLKLYSCLIYPSYQDPNKKPLRLGFIHSRTKVTILVPFSQNTSTPTLLNKNYFVNLRIREFFLF